MTVPEPIEWDEEVEGRYERLELMPWWDSARVRASKFLVVGAGAIGNEVLKNLALLGAGTIYIVDNDDVERTNLARSVLFRESDEGENKAVAAAQALRALNPDVQVIPLPKSLQEVVGVGLVRICNAVIGCVDNVPARLHLDKLAWLAGVDHLDGAISALGFQIQPFDHSLPQSHRYADLLPEGVVAGGVSCRDIQIRAHQGGHIATTPLSASLCGAFLVQEALKRLHQNGEGRPRPLRGHALVGQGFSNDYVLERFPPASKEAQPPSRTLVLDSDWGSTSLGEMVDLVQDSLGSKYAILDIGVETKIEATCPACQTVHPILSPDWFLGDLAGVCCDQEGFDPSWGLAVAEGGHIHKGLPALDLSPKAWSLPPMHEYLGMAPDCDEVLILSFKEDRTAFEKRFGGP
ncbi:ThiF family adenylyltransferase [bacterium]|nr:ThiF family adenylyltransferase [bacterium]